MLKDRVWEYVKLMRLNNPIGTILLFIPCLLGVCLGTPPGTFPDVILLAKFFGGAVLTRSAGCIVNDVWDADIDKYVERTKNRPLASNSVSLLGAVFLTVTLMLLAFLILITFPITCVMMGIISTFFIFLYPSLKRITNWPQAFLGLSFSMGSLMGVASTKQDVPITAAISLYLGCVLWTIFYDTIYAFQDYKDDMKLELKSTAQKFIKSGSPRLCLAAVAIGSILSWGLCGHITSQKYPYYFGLLSCGIHFTYQILKLDVNNSSRNMTYFKSHRFIGLYMALGLILSSYLQSMPNISLNQ